jgi:hypothetical protein
MKKLNFLAFLVAIAFVSCAKSDAPTPTTAFVAPKPSIDVAAALIGSWTLSAFGKLTTNTSTGGGGCGDSGSSTQVVWSTTSDDEMLSFAKNGDFVQLKQSKEACRGTYSLNLGNATLTNSCANEAQNFSDVSDKSLTLNDGTTFLRFDKTSPNPY